MNTPDIASLLQRLVARTDRRLACRDLLAALRASTQAALAASRYGGNAQVGLAAVHLRGAGGYQDLIWDGEPGEGRQTDPRLASETAWRLLLGLGVPVLLDISAGTWAPLDPSPGPSASTALAWLNTTRADLGGRQVSHLLALPMRGPGGVLCGMVHLEVDCPRAVARRLDAFATVQAELSAQVDLATAFIRGLAHTGERAPDRTDLPLLPVIGRSMRGPVETLRLFARLDETILLRGPTGCGKSHLARTAHQLSCRAAAPFVVAEVHTVAAPLREAALFGWRKGSFTGAVSDGRGRVAEAEGGTLFIDEVDKLDLSAQGKLLRLLDERRYRVVGEDHDRDADIRFVVATNADLEADVAAGRFLADLYWRIGVLPVEVPALRERADEIGGWAAHMLRSLAGQGRSASLSEGALRELSAHTWPGNLRQLHSVVVRAYALARGAGPVGVDVLLDREHIVRALLMDRQPRPAQSLVELLVSAAGQLLRVAEREAGTPGGHLDLEKFDVLQGAVLCQAVATQGDPRRAFCALGLEQRLQGGNHLRTLRRERERLVHLCALAGEVAPPHWLP